jgi:hypothetical protein
VAVEENPGVKKGPGGLVPEVSDLLSGTGVEPLLVLNRETIHIVYLRRLEGKPFSLH